MTDIPERKNPFPVRLRLVWNDTLVMDAQCSVVVAYDVARQHMTDNFAGSDHAARMAYEFGNLDRLVSTRRLDVEWKDSTGYARAVVEAL